MGQQQGTGGGPCCGAAARAEAGEARYSGRGLEELRGLASERGLLPGALAGAGGQRGGAAAERSALVALLQAYDAGAHAATVLKEHEGSPQPSPCGGRDSRCTGCASDETVVQRMLSAPGLKGVDIGGSLAKFVLALPQTEALCQADCRHSFPEVFGATGRTHSDLELDFHLGSEPCRLHFFSGATAQVASAVAGVRRQRRPRRGGHPGRGLPDEAAEEAEEPCTPRGKARPAEQLFTAGGGAHKFAPLFRDALDIELVPVKELSAVVDGLLLLASQAGRGEVFALDGAGAPAPAPWPEPLFPFLVVNIGSGVSILRVDSAEEGGYTRVGGTACGGATFLGLARAMTSARTFGDALELAEGGDAARCDLLVRDIYGETGSASLGLPGGLTAANCGRLCEEPPEGGCCSEQDLARSLLQMITQQAVLLSSAFARDAGCVDRVFFAGGFVEEANHIARKAIAANLRSLGGCAYFLRHSDFLGALGSLRSCVQASGGGAGLPEPSACQSPSLASEPTSLGSRSWSTASTASTSPREGL